MCVCVCVMNSVCKDYASSGLGSSSATGATAVSNSPPPWSPWTVVPASLVNNKSSTFSGSTSFGSRSLYVLPQPVVGSGG
jgi:hypothetical protein